MPALSPDSRVPTGIAGLDAMLGGGFLPGDATLVAGSPGTGKTTVGLHFLAAGVARNERGVLVTFEYLPQQIYRDAAAKGWPLKEWERDGRVRVVCTTPDLLLAETKEGVSILDEVVRGLGARRLVIDSMTHFEYFSEGSQKLRANVAGLMNHLRLLNVTTLVTHEIPQIIGPTLSISTYGLEFLVDNVIMLRHLELDGEMQKAIVVMKFRGGDHDRKYRSFLLTGKGLVVEAEFKGVENISMGSATRPFATRARELI